LKSNSVHDTSKISKLHETLKITNEQAGEKSRMSFLKFKNLSICILFQKKKMTSFCQSENVIVLS